MSTLQYRGLKLSQGNAKLKKTDKVDFLVWSITPLVTCPFSTMNCRNACYAKKAYRLYPNYRKMVDTNYELTQGIAFVSNMIKLIEGRLSKLKTGKTIYFRIHESGDFYDFNYFFKWHLITDYFKDDKRIVFQAYTKSLSFIHELIRRDSDVNSIKDINIHFTFSAWNDTNSWDIDSAEVLGIQLFVVDYEYKITNDIYECKCADCGACGQCYKDDFKMIVVKKH